MQNPEFKKRLMEIFTEYLTNKYPRKFIPLCDVLFAWGYSINSYSHLKKICEEILIKFPEEDTEYISVESFIDITLNKRLNIDSF